VEISEVIKKFTAPVLPHLHIYYESLIKTLTLYRSEWSVWSNLG